MTVEIIVGPLIAVVVILALGAHFEISRRIRGNPDSWYHD